MQIYKEKKMKSLSVRYCYKNMEILHIVSIKALLYLVLLYLLLFHKINIQYSLKLLYSCQNYQRKFISHLVDNLFSSALNYFPYLNFNKIFQKLILK